MEPLTLETLGGSSRMTCMSCGKTISTDLKERAALKAGQSIKPRQCRDCKPRAKKPEPRKPPHPYRFYTCAGCGVERRRYTAELRDIAADGPPPPPRQCRECKVEPAEHGTPREYFRGCRCDECRVAAAKYNRERLAATGYKRPPMTAESRGGYEKRCTNPACMDLFYTSDKRKVVCSNECNWSLRRQRAASAIAPVKYDSEFAEVQQHRLDAGLHDFTRWRKDWISDKRRRSIYERDSYICKICAEQCSERFSVDDLLSPTLDHVLPWSKAEEWPHLHDDFNLRTVHWTCNSSRQNDWSSAEWLSFMVVTEDVSVEEARRVRASR